MADKALTPGSKALPVPPAGLQPKSLKSACGSPLTATGFCVQALTGFTRALMPRGDYAKTLPCSLLVISNTKWN